MFRKKDDIWGLEVCTEPSGSAGLKNGGLFSALMPENSGEPENDGPSGDPEPSGKQEEEVFSSRMATKKKQRKKEIISWIISLSAAVVFALFLRFFVFEFVRVDGPSMQNTLWSDEIVLVEKVSYRFSQPQRFDIVFFNTQTEGTLVKRVIGLPGDKVEIKNFKLYINDNEIEENYIKEPMDEDYGPVEVQADTLLCLGDNRNVSVDSRSEIIGPVPYNTILGRGVFIIWPLNRISALPEVTAGM